MRQTRRLLSASVSPTPTGLCRLSSLPAALWPFPTLSLRIFLYVQEPLPRLLLWCTHPFLPTRLRPSQRSHPVGALADLHALATSAWGTFRGCSYSIIFQPVDLLATPVAPTVTPFGIRQPWLVLPRLSQFVTSLSRGYANRLNRVIGGRGTSTLLDSQPCRLLRHPSRPFALACRDSLSCRDRPASAAALYPPIGGQSATATTMTLRRQKAPAAHAFAATGLRPFATSADAAGAPPIPDYAPSLRSPWRAASEWSG